MWLLQNPGDPPIKGCSWLILGRVFPHLKIHDPFKTIKSQALFVSYDVKTQGSSSFFMYEILMLTMYFLSTKISLSQLLSKALKT